MGQSSQNESEDGTIQFSIVLHGVVFGCTFLKVGDGYKFDSATSFPLPTGKSKIINGAKGMIQAAIGIDRATDELIESRNIICLECNHAKRVGGKAIKCDICGCRLRSKMVLFGESCPIGKW